MGTRYRARGTFSPIGGDIVHAILDRGGQRARPSHPTAYDEHPPVPVPAQKVPMTRSPSRAESLAVRREEILAQLAEIERELAALRTDREGVGDDDEHDPDGVPLSAQWSSIEGRKESKLSALDALDEAIGRLERGEDGLCRSCGRPIPPARLAVRPEATTCIDCAV